MNDHKTSPNDLYNPEKPLPEIEIDEPDTSTPIPEGSDDGGHEPIHENERICGPDMTPFLRALILSALTWIRQQRQLKGGSIPLLDAIRWLRANGMFLDWRSRRYSIPGSCPINCPFTYEICDVCVHDHWIGNFMYGFLCRLLGIPDWMATAGGSVVQRWGGGGGWIDPPWDRAGYRLARTVHNALTNQGNINLCAILKSNMKDWNEANDTSATGGWLSPLYPKPHVTGYGNCGPCPKILGAPTSTTFPGASFSPPNTWPPI